jgi:glycosyltransferase involved in cell wall biosynthesis
MVSVSVIVPVYNVEPYLVRCLNSLVQQTLHDIEIICVDDCSPDRSIDILRQYETDFPGKVRVIQSDINRRQGGARNLGIRAACGDYIGFVDSDDWVDIRMFEMLYNKAVETGSDVVDCNYYLAFPDSLVECKSNSPSQCGELGLDKKRTVVTNPGRTWTKLYKRTLWLDNQVFFPEHLLYEDNEIMPLIMVYAEKLAKIEDCLYYYFVGTGGSTTEKRNDQNQFDRLTTSINMYNHFKNRGLLDRFGLEIEYRFIKLYYIVTIPLCLNRFDPPEMKRLKEIRDYMKSFHPNYRRNRYFQEKESRYTKCITLANDASPQLARVLNQTARTMIRIIPGPIKKKILSPRSALLGR